MVSELKHGKWIETWQVDWNMASELKHAKYDEDWRSIQKAFISIHTISLQWMVSPLLTCVQLAQVDSLWYHTPAQLLMYTLTQPQTYIQYLHKYIDTYVHRSTTVVHEHMYTWKWTYVYVNVHWSMEHLLVARDVTLGYLGLVVVHTYVRTSQESCGETAVCISTYCT